MKNFFCGFWCALVLLFSYQAFSQSIVTQDRDGILRIDGVPVPRLPPQSIDKVPPGGVMPAGGFGVDHLWRAIRVDENGYVICSPGKQ